MHLHAYILCIQMYIHDYTYVYMQWNFNVQRGTAKHLASPGSSLRPSDLQELHSDRSLEHGPAKVCQYIGLPKSLGGSLALMHRPLCAPSDVLTVGLLNGRKGGTFFPNA